MDEQALYGKRKKKKIKCPNPLFEQWLKEWKEDAANKGIKLQYVYSKALKSLQKFPLKLNSGKECKILENFGDKLCKMLDERLGKHIAEYGSADPPDEDDNCVPVEKPKPKPMHKPAAAPQPTAEVGTVHRVTHDLSESDEEVRTQPPPKKRHRSDRQSGEREYIPAYRSGPYAILITLYRDMQSADGRGFMTKTELTNKAQALADKSFTIPDPGCRYTSWSSMGTLIKKGLVIKESSPARYSLTDAGCQLAHRLEAIQNDGGFTCVRPSTNARTNIVINPTNPQTQSLKYTYVTDEGNEVKDKDRAAVLIDDDVGVGFLIKCNYQKLLASGKRYKLDTTRPLGDDVYVYLHDDDTEDNTVGEPYLPTLNMMEDDRISDQLPTLNTIDDDQAHISAVSPKKIPKKRSKKVVNDVTSAMAAPQLISLMDNLPDTPLMDPPRNNLKPSHTRDHVISDSDNDDSNSVTSMSSLASVQSKNSLASKCPMKSFQDSSSQDSVSSSSTVQSSSTPSFVLYPGQYEIILCVDNAEFYGSRQGGSKSMLPDLIKNGVKCDLRKLHVGDLLWIAREMKPQTPMQLEPPKCRELVLDYVIERKRMDDLVHSCTDGRLSDQKFRLKHCGLRKQIFMVEDYGSLQHFSIAEDRIRQTITNLKVIDGFQVKRTKDVKESVAYLTVMTRYLQSYFKNKTLYSCSLDEIREQKLEHDINDSEMRLMVFDEFNQGSVKSKNLNVREMFCKHLSKVCGMSAERAFALTEVYPTLTSLINAYRNCSDKKAAENLLSTIKVNKSQRSLGANPSKFIYMLYNTRGPLA